MSDKNNMNFYIINIECSGKIINLIQIITSFIHIYIKQTHLLRRQKIAHNSRKGNKEPLRNGKHNSILTKLFLKPLIVGVTYAANITVLIISFY